MNHAASGLAVGLATLPWLPTADPVTQVMWVVALAGASLLPDLDTTQSSSSLMWGPVSGVLAAGLSRVSGGHRQGTHDLVLAPLVCGVLAGAAGIHPIPAGVLLALLIGLTLRAVMVLGFGRVGAIANLAASIAGASWLVAQHAEVGLLPWILTLGVVTHIAGDWVTTEGVPVPLAWLRGDRRRMSLNLFEVDSLLERTVVAPALILLAALGLAGWHLRVDEPGDLPVLVGQLAGRLAAALSHIPWPS